MFLKANNERIGVIGLYEYMKPRRGKFIKESWSEFSAVSLYNIDYTSVKQRRTLTINFLFNIKDQNTRIQTETTLEMIQMNIIFESVMWFYFFHLTNL